MTDLLSVLGIYVQLSVRFCYSHDNAKAICYFTGSKHSDRVTRAQCRQDKISHIGLGSVDFAI